MSIDLPVVVVSFVTRPKVFVKTTGIRTAAAQIITKAITKANVFGQLEQPKQPCSIVPTSYWEKLRSSTNCDVVFCENISTGDVVHELLACNSDDDDDDDYWYNNWLKKFYLFKYLYIISEITFNIPYTDLKWRYFLKGLLQRFW